MNVDYTIVMVIASITVLALAVWRVRREPRRVSTGMLIVAGVVLLWVSTSNLVYQYDEPAGTLMTSGVLYILVPIALLAVASAAVINGVVVMRREGIRLANALPLAFGLASFVLYALAVLQVVRSPDADISAVIVSILSIYIYVGSLLTGYTAYALLNSRLPRLENVHTIVTLGCSLSGHLPTPLLRSRLDRALRVGNHGDDPLHVPSGGQGGEILSEAQAMATYLVEQGVAEDRVLLEDRSTTTRQNLEYTHRLLERDGLPTRGVVVVTSNFHVLRSASLARSLGYDWVVVGAPTARYYVSTAFLREFAAYLTYHKWIHLAVVALLVIPTLAAGLLS
ncbi:YdcF family protein [Rhodococcus sp. NPDC058521]|uniref:YdcF family protein n=1 Tax=Rhodococcus sp. NPDC058521 TaxID=3346536 RepID=UPI0036489F47